MAARVASLASSTRAFFSFISTSVAAPTLITATPPASLARRSCSFSLVVLRRGVLDLTRESASRGLDVGLACPAPSTIVVLSLSMVMRLASPRSAICAFSSLKPASSEMTRPPVRIAMSSQHGLAAVAEARRLDGAHLERAAQLVDDQSRERFAFDVLGDDQAAGGPAGPPSRGPGAGPSSTRSSCRR